MTLMTISVDESEVELLKEKLGEVSSAKIEKMEVTEPVKESALERIKRILDEARGKELFKEIEDPSEWQRQIRKEWDRDF